MWRGLALLAVLFVGCGEAVQDPASDSASVDIPIGPDAAAMSEDGLTAWFVEHAVLPGCERSFRCHNQGLVSSVWPQLLYVYGPVEHCLASHFTQFPSASRRVARAVLAGRQTVDVVRLLACEQERAGSCARPVGEVCWSADGWSLAPDVFAEPAVNEGGPCSSTSDCRTGRCDNGGKAACGGTCRTVFAAAGQPCGWWGDCEKGTTCGWSKPRVCVPWPPPDGAKCDNALVCGPGRACHPETGTCGPPMQEGEPCFDALTSCADGLFCAVTGWAAVGVCRRQRPVGAACNGGLQCLLGLACVQPFGGGPGACRLRVMPGEPCDGPSHCAGSAYWCRPEGVGGLCSTLPRAAQPCAPEVRIEDALWGGRYARCWPDSTCVGGLCRLRGGPQDGCGDATSCRFGMQCVAGQCSEPLEPAAGCE